ncbi:hypothetical protein BDV93DRAFT_413802, partial [Ceratobasidium sp. AG-I]
CSACTKLLADPIVLGMCKRATNGCSKKTNHSFLTINQLRELLRRQASQVNTLKLTLLNQACTLASRVRHLDDFNQFLGAVASGKVER